jgi:transcriptional regulator with XRE-family HTH domain
VEHFLDDAREFVGRHGLTMDLARYLNVTDRPVRGWLRRERIPMQATLEAIHKYLLAKKGNP